MELTEISGIGAARKKSFNESGIYSADDLISYFPYKYYDFSKTEPYADDGNVRLIFATVVDGAKVIKTRGNLSMVTCKMVDETGKKFNAVWFNQTYIKSVLYLGLEIFLYGKNSSSKKGTFNVLLAKPAEKFKLGYLPVYHAIAGIGQKTLSDAINSVLLSKKITSIIPEHLEKRYKLIDLNTAYREIHLPTSEQGVDAGYERVQIEKIVPLLGYIEFNKKFFKTEKSQKYFRAIALKDEFEKLLPFSLTPEQNSAVYDIEKDLSSKFSMNRMIQGDVGSGKTAVALYGAYVAVKNGYQAVIIAPTEILASQHYDFISKIFAKENINVVLFSGSLSNLEKRETLNKIESGEAQIIVGTHSVFGEKVNYKNLSYVVIDEQHRFGVEQRKKLKEKGVNPDVLVMSATPIPRTLSLVIYGDLDMTIISSRPKPFSVKTNIVSPAKQDDMWKFVADKINGGSLVYVVCAKIDEENESDSVRSFSAKSMYEFLSEKFGENAVGLIHGKLSKEKQNKIICDFKCGKIKILVSTTIVEVGVDIPESDIMVIATPERFGLATLHQLRGRIGRNGKEAFCFCLSDLLNEKSYERISFFKSHTNGFEIAEYDMAERGSGSIIGTNQHGEDNGIFNRITTETYGRAKEILEACKCDVSLFAQIIERGEQLYNNDVFGKVVFN